MNELFKVKVSETEYEIGVEFDEAAKTVSATKNGLECATKAIVWKLNTAFLPVVLDESNVVFVCVERNFGSWLDKLLCRNPVYSIDLFLEGVSVKDGSPMTRRKDGAVSTLEKGFGKYIIKKLKWTAVPAALLVALFQVILLATNNFRPYNYGIVDALLNLAEFIVLVVFFTCLGWYNNAVTVEKWDSLFD